MVIRQVVVVRDQLVSICIGLDGLAERIGDLQGDVGVSRYQGAVVDDEALSLFVIDEPVQEILCCLSLGIGGLIYPKLCFLFPIFLIGTIQFLSLNARSFFAALMGGLMPFWFLLAYGLVMRDIDLIVSPFLSLGTFQPLGIGYELWQLPLYVLLLTLFIVSTTHIYLTTYDERMRTRVFLRFLIFLGGFLLLCMPLQPQEAIHLFPLASVPISLIAAHFFALTESRLSLAFTIFTLIALVGTYLFCLWML